MQLYKRYKKYILMIIFILLIIIIFGVYFSPTAIGFDENYTLALINHSYHNIIYLDSMDVHPILYYFLLKTFINCTTFWTSSFLFKIIFARVFSLIISILLFVYLVRILKLLDIKNNIFLEWILFLILPGVLNSSGVTDSQLVTIRMYGLASLFIVAEVFNLLKYDVCHNHKYIYISTILAICAAYTHYYAAIFGGLLLLIYFIKNILHKNNDYKYFLLSGIILLLCYIPWMPIFIKQASNPYTYWMTNLRGVKQDLRFIILLLLFIYPIYKWYKNSNNKLFSTLLCNIALTLLPTFILVFIYSFINHPMFEVRYMLPVLVIYEFISINIAIKFLLANKIKIISIFILFVCLFGGIKSCKYQMSQNQSSVYVSDKYKFNKNEEINAYSIKNCAGGVLTNMLYTKHNALVPLKYKNIFKKNLNIFHNPMYVYLFKNEINRIKFR